MALSSYLRHMNLNVLPIFWTQIDLAVLLCHFRSFSFSRVWICDILGFHFFCLSVPDKGNTKKDAVIYQLCYFHMVTFLFLSYFLYVSSVSKSSYIYILNTFVQMQIYLRLFTITDTDTWSSPNSFFAEHVSRPDSCVLIVYKVRTESCSWSWCDGISVVCLVNCHMNGKKTYFSFSWTLMIG